MPFRITIGPLLFCAALCVAITSGPDVTNAEDTAAVTPEQSDYPSTFYRYRGKRGRWVFTNILDEVPANQRDGAKLDLSHITLNTQVGAELDASMQYEFETLSASPECREVKEQAAHWARVVWDDYGHLIVLGVVFLALVLGTPYALRRVDAPTWARTLTKSFMLIGFVGVFMHTTVSAGKTYRAMKEAAAPCERDNWNALAKEPTAGRSGQLKMLMDLQSMIRNAKNQTGEDRLKELDKLLSQ